MLNQHSQFSSVLVVLLIIASAGTAAAQSADEDTGECKIDRGAAKADGALLWAPQLYARAGSTEPSIATAVPEFSDRVRYDVGGRISLAGVYQSVLLNQRAEAACAWRNARLMGNSAVVRAGLQAKLAVLQQQLEKGAAIQSNMLKQVAARLVKASDITGFALRLEQLRYTVAEIERALAALPLTAVATTDAVTAARNLSAADVRLRRARAWDISLQAGFSSFATGESATIASVNATLSLGALFTGTGNDRIAEGRMQVAVKTKVDIAAMIEQDSKRDQELAQVLVLIDDELAGIDKLGNLAGEEWRRKQQTLWFDRALLGAESAALKARLALMTGGSK